MHKQHKAFTLVELMVAMAIIAVLIGMSVFGIATAQRVLRDNQRRDNLKNVAAALNSYYATNSTYPSSIASVSGDKTKIQVGTMTVPAAGILQVSTATSTNGTWYCYKLDSSGYMLGVKLEDSAWFNLGSSPNLCSDAASNTVN